jgi:hypothetical protein
MDALRHFTQAALFFTSYLKIGDGRMSMEHWDSDIDRGKCNCSDKSLCHFLCVHHKSHTDLTEHNTRPSPSETSY